MSYLADLERKYVAALDRIKQLEADVDALRDDLRALTITDLPPQLRLTGKEAALFRALLSKPEMTKEQILAAMYADRYGLGEEPDIKIVDVFVCKLRRKLKPIGLEIETLHGRGYSISAEGKRRIGELCDEAIRPAPTRTRADGRGLHAIRAA